MANLMPWRRKEGEASALSTPWFFRREFDDLMERVFDEGPMVSGIFGDTFFPAVNIAENENEIVVTAEIPGMENEDLDVSLTGDVLTIRGEKKAEHEEKGDNYHRMERSYGSFCRSFTLPCDVERDKVDATYKHGVLTLKLPKSETGKTKSMKIAVN